MLIRATLALLAVAACATDPSPPPLPTGTAIGESTGSKCDPPNYPCNPMESVANGICEWVCGNGEPGAGHCHPYTSVEEVWCALHPDHVMSGNPLRYCDPRGNPTWDTHCVPGWLP